MLIHWLLPIILLSCIGGEDYIDVFPTLVITADSACVSLSLIDDEVYENTEGLSVELSSTDPQVIVTTPSAPVTILDNDDGEL